LREWLIKFTKNKQEVYSILSNIPPAELERGRLLITAGIAECAFKILGGDDMRVLGAEFTDGGVLQLKADVKGMKLSYRLKPTQFTIDRGRLLFAAEYAEEREGGGLSGALLGMTGKSGLAFALQKHRWAKVDNTTLRIELDGLPQDSRAQLVNVTRQGILLRLN